MNSQDVLQYLEDVMDDEGLHGGQQINTLLEAVDSIDEDDNPRSDDDDE
ncbi:unnamed protein product [marine sediment metagenome]|uniref:Uncharacterized protein n=1 Tax=marine sediment metagenome TaxID=412755 RepID=X1M8B8_9ZZZZ